MRAYNEESQTYSAFQTIACPNGLTVGDDFAPYRDIGYLKPCSKIIEQYQFLDEGHSAYVLL
jgi:hypothetical protein